MRVPKEYIGRFMVVYWLDPCSRSVDIHTKDASDVPKGEKGLGRRRERGILADISDSKVGKILRIEHWDSLADWEDQSDQLYATWVPEGLVYQIDLYTKEKEEH